MTITKPLFLSALRQLKSTMSRFIAIFFIVLLGVSCYAGLKASGPEMKRTADIYFHNKKLSDIQLVSSLGFTDEDVDAIRQQENINALHAGYSGNYFTDYKYNGISSSGTDRQELTIQIQSLPSNISDDNPDYLNQITLIEDSHGVMGRMPEKDNEVVMIRSYTNYNVGDTFTVYDNNKEESLNIIKEREYEVVGIANTPVFITSQFGNSNVGSGIISGVAYTPVTNFTSDIYTNIYATFKNTQNLDAFSQEYKDVVSQNMDDLKVFTEDRANIRYEGIVSDVQEKIDEAKNNIETAKSQIQTAEEKLNNLQTEINQSSSELSNSQSEYKVNKQKYDSALADINASYADVDIFFQQANSLNEANQQLQQSRDQVGALQAQGNEMQALAIQNEIYKQEAQIIISTSNSMRQQANDFEASGDADMANTFRNLANQVEQDGTPAGAASILQNQGNVSRQQLDSAKQDLNIQSKDLEEAAAQIAEAEKKLKEGQAELATQRSNFEAEQQNAQTEIAEGEEQTKESQEELDALEKPEWFIWDRTYNVGFLDFQDNADRVGNIAKVFPVFFLLVALLVCLTTMARMVDDERTQIGTLKVLGYSNSSIILKYLVYAISASLLGGIAGSFLGYAIFPPVIVGAYSMLYFLPSVGYHYWISYAIISIAAGVICTVGATVWACYSTFVSIPTQLLHPKVPPPGKPVLLERIGILWRRLKFSQKVTIRNLFRYKQRFIMTVIGIAGCTACLLTGFGLRDAIFDIDTYQFNNLSFYNALISLENPSDSQSDTNLNKVLRKDGEFAYLRLTSVNVTNGDKSLTNGVNLAVLENVDQFAKLNRFQNRKTGDQIYFDDKDGVILTEKLAMILNVDVGDTFDMSTNDTDPNTLTVIGVNENYVSNYIYMKPETAEKLEGEKPEFKTVLLGLNDELENQTENDEQARKDVLEEIVSSGNVSSVSDTDVTRAQVVEQLDVFNVLVTVIIIASCSLAVVVLYNLTNINIIERKREIASLKVLGFSEREVAWYIYRENWLLVLIGIMFGLVMGIFLERYVVLTTEVSSVMFRRIIKPLSFGLSIMFTLFSNVIVSLIMTPKIRDIEMVESLKSTD